jgi:hypothetical protein
LMKFVPISLFSSWLVSGLRYSAGLPFQLLSWSEKDFSLWINKYELLLIFILFLYYAIASKRLAEKVVLNGE